MVPAVTCSPRSATGSMLRESKELIAFSNSSFCSSVTIGFASSLTVTPPEIEDSDDEPPFCVASEPEPELWEEAADELAADDCAFEDDEPDEFPPQPDKITAETVSADSIKAMILFIYFTLLIRLIRQIQ